MNHIYRKAIQEFVWSMGIDVSIYEIAKGTGITKPTTKRHVEQLHKEKLFIEVENPSRNINNKRYKINKEMYDRNSPFLYSKDVKITDDGKHHIIRIPSFLVGHYDVDVDKDIFRFEVKKSKLKGELIKNEKKI